MGLFSNLFHKKNKTTSPSLTIEKTSGGGMGSQRRDVAQSLLNDERKIQEKQNEFNALDQNNPKLTTLTEQIDGLRNNMRKTMTDNNISPSNNSDIYNMYVKGTQFYTNKSNTQNRIDALESLLQGNLEPLPSYDNLSKSSRRQATDEGFDEPEEGTNLPLDEPEEGENLFSDGEGEEKEGNIYDDFDDQALKDYRKDIEEQLRSDPTNQSLRDEIGNIDNEQTRRGGNLQVELDAEGNPIPPPPDTPPPPLEPPSSRARDTALRGQLDPDDPPPPPPTHETAEIPAHTDPQELEGTTTLQSDPNIEQGKEEIPDATIFRKFLHIGAELSFDFLKQSSGYGGLLEGSKKMLEKVFDVELKDLVNKTAEIVNTFQITDIGSLRGTTPDRIKLQIKDAQLQEHSIINNAVLYPLLVASFKFYLIKKEADFGMMGDNVFYYGLEYLLKNFVKLEQNKITYLLYCWSNFPNDLGVAFLRNSDAPSLITDVEKASIKAYHTNSIKEYDRLFAPNKFVEDVKRYEHGGTALNQMIINLANPIFLFEVSKVYDAVDEFILNVGENQGILLGLMGLLYSRALGEGTNMGDALLSNARIDGIVYYTRQTNTPKIENKEVEMLENATQEVEEKIIDGVKYIVLRGTNPKQEKFLERDFVKNILNMAGSPELFTNEAFNNRIVKATEIIDRTEREGDMPIKIIAYSLGGVFGLYLSSIYPDIPVELYSPVLANNEATTQLMNGIERQGSNLKINIIKNDPISTNVGQYKGRFNIQEKEKSRFFDAHSLNNYLF